MTLLKPTLTFSPGTFAFSNLMKNVDLDPEPTTLNENKSMLRNLAEIEACLEYEETVE